MRRYIIPTMLLVAAGSATALLLTSSPPELEEVVVEVRPSVSPGLSAAITETTPKSTGLSAAATELSAPVVGLSAVVVELFIPPNQPPACDADGPYDEQCAGTTTTVQLDGGASSDPDDDALTFAWSTDCPGGTFDDPAGQTPILTVDTAPGCSVNCTVTLTVTDDIGESDICDATATITDTAAPVLTVDTTPITVIDEDCSGDEGVTLPTGGAADVCGSATVANDAPSPFPAGQTTTVTYTATDDCNNTSTDSLNVTVLYGADIFIIATRHTVGSGSHPGSTKEPLVGIEVCAYDKADGSCSRVTCGGISHQHYQCIVDSCGTDDGELIFCCTTDSNGECTINAPPGDYIVISDDATKTTLPDPLGVSASDLVCGELKQKHLQQIVKADGKTVPGKTTRRTGSELLIIEPEYVVWDNTEQLYPFVFESVGDWGVNATVAPPEGFVADYGELSAQVNGVIESVQFTVTEVGSDLVPTGTTFTVTHRGRREIIHSKVGIFVTPEYARSRGFNVARLRARGLIRERPGSQGQGDEHRR